MSTILAAFIGAALGFLQDYFAKRRAEQAMQDVGRVTAERDQAVEGRLATEAMLEASLGAPRDVDEAAARLEKGSA